jgi:hypothetical protein
VVSDIFETITRRTIETVASVVAAGAAVVAVYFARDTVRESIAGRKDAERHHVEQIGECKPP